MPRAITKCLHKEIHLKKKATIDKSKNSFYREM